MSGLPDGVPKLLAGSTLFGVEKSMSSALARTSCMTSLADNTFVPGAPDRSGCGWMPASRAWLSSRPTTPAAMPVASDEQLLDGIDTNV